MQELLSPIRAAIDIGSNTIHIVIARCRPNTLEIIEDQLEIVRIGESVTATGAISPQKRKAAIDTLCRYHALAKQHSAQQVLVVATEAIRQATNSRQFLQQIKRRTGLHVHLISGNVEATLTFYGATYHLAQEPTAPVRLAVMDLGGGSTELVTAKDMHISWRTSLPVGSGWLHDRYLPANPPTSDDLAVAHMFLRTYLQGVDIKEQPSTLIVTGGSANSLLHLAQQAYKLDSQCHRLMYDDLLRCEGLLSALTAEDISQRYGQPTARTRLLPAGALIIRTIMARLNLSEITVSPHGIREGVLLVYERYGKNWLEIVNEEPFFQSGQRMIQERITTLFDWCDEVLKHEDMEAVHKMRVASRRLRATLDAYQPCCHPKQFQKAYRAIKQLADLLGSARDADVLLQELDARLAEAATEEHSAIQWLVDQLYTYRQQKQLELENFLASLDVPALKHSIQSCVLEGTLHNGKS